MPTLVPQSILEITGITGAISAVQDDPVSPDASWLTTTNNNIATSVRVSFTSALPSGSQTFRALVRKFGGTGTPTSRIELWQGGTLIRAGSNQSVSGNTTLSFSWTASELTATGNAELKVVGIQTGGSGSVRATVEVGAIAWDYTAAPPATLDISSVVADSISSFSLESKAELQSNNTLESSVSTISVITSEPPPLEAQISSTTADSISSVSTLLVVVSSLSSVTENSSSSISSSSVQVSSLSGLTQDSVASISQLLNNLLDVVSSTESSIASIEILDSSSFNINATTDSAESLVQAILHSTLSLTTILEEAISSFEISVEVPTISIQANLADSYSDVNFESISSLGVSSELSQTMVNWNLNLSTGSTINSSTEQSNSSFVIQKIIVFVPDSDRTLKAANERDGKAEEIVRKAIIIKSDNIFPA